MGARGPLKIPNHLRVVPGQPANPSDAKSASVADVMRASRPDIPKSLPVSLHAMWNDIVDGLEQSGLLSKCDGPALELALRHYAAAIKASDALAAGDVVVDDAAHDGVKKNPAEPVFRTQSLAFLEYAKQLGLTLVARARTTLPDDSSKRASDTNPFL